MKKLFRRFYNWLFSIQYGYMFGDYIRRLNDEMQEECRKEDAALGGPELRKLNKVFPLCEGCSGRGFVTGTEPDGSYQDYPCPFCDGTGKEPDGVSIHG